MNSDIFIFWLQILDFSVQLLGFNSLILDLGSELTA